MKRFIITTLIGLIALTAGKAQEYKLAKSTGKLVINLASIKVEGYSGSEIVFSTVKEDREEDERAKGLRPINGSGLIDNTGIGINVTDKGATIEVSQVSSKDKEIKILVPKGVSVSYAYNKVMNAGKASFKNVEGELEISVQHNSVNLDNVTGPLTVKAIYGSVDAKFGANIKGPISIVSIYGHVDVAIPETIKANLTAKTSYGEILASSELKIELEKTTKDDMVSYSNNNVKGKLNGGGPEFSLRSDYSKIYLRKTN
ncbi:DUF4097 family beta strand repeat-containing protein [Chitinophagaceae bacterium LWZ2-11]